MKLNKMILFFCLILSLICPNIYSAQASSSSSSSSADEDKRGVIFVLEGVSSCGKTKIANELINELSDINVLKMSLDDIDEDEDFSSEDENSDSESKNSDDDNYSSISESEISSDDDSDEEKSIIIHDPYEEDTEADKNKLMISKLREVSDEGFNIVYDTVITPEYISKFINYLKESGQKVYTIHVFCSPGVLAKRTMSRNSAAITPQQVEAEGRSPHQPFGNLKKRYRLLVKGEENRNALTFSPTADILQLRELFGSPYPIIGSQGEVKQYKLSQDEGNRILSGINSDLGIEGNEVKVSIVPIYNYDLAVDNDNPNAFTEIKEFIMKKLGQIN